MDKKKRERKFYTTEFKREAVERSRQIGFTKTKDELGISPSALTRWRKEFSENNTPNTKNKPTYQELEKEVQRLRKELVYVDEINRVLKKSTAIFSKKELGDLK